MICEIIVPFSQMIFDKLLFTMGLFYMINKKVRLGGGGVKIPSSVRKLDYTEIPKK